LSAERVLLRSRSCSLAVGSDLMVVLRVMQGTRNDKNKNKGFEGGQYARTQGELRKKALELLHKCKIETRR
jgi:hypothetical protein